MKERVLFQLYFQEGEKKGQKLEVMDVDMVHWEALRTQLNAKYPDPGLLSYLRQDLPIHLTRDAFLATEKEMRKVKDADLDENAYIAMFSIDIFLRQLDELVDSDILFESNVPS